MSFDSYLAPFIDRDEEINIETRNFIPDNEAAVCAQFNTKNKYEESPKHASEETNRESDLFAKSVLESEDSTKDTANEMNGHDSQSKLDEIYDDPSPKR